MHPTPPPSDGKCTPLISRAGVCTAFHPAASTFCESNCIFMDNYYLFLSSLTPAAHRLSRFLFLTPPLSVSSSWIILAVCVNERIYFCKIPPRALSGWLFLLIPALPTSQHDLPKPSLDFPHWTGRPQMNDSAWNGSNKKARNCVWNQTKCSGLV